jgi:hypothetical protein
MFCARYNKTHLMIEKVSDTKGYRMTLFVNPKDPKEELWNGSRCCILQLAYSELPLLKVTKIRNGCCHTRIRS